MDARFVGRLERAIERGQEQRPGAAEPRRKGVSRHQERQAQSGCRLCWFQMMDVAMTGAHRNEIGRQE
jgi:hypothetical protein